VIARSALRTALNLLESTRAADAAAQQALVDSVAAADGHPNTQVVGLTGPPGVGKSTLAGQMVRTWREAGLSVGVLAVDPSSKRSGGAVLGDRARMDRDPADSEVFIRSMAARDHLGGLAPATFDAALVMRAHVDRVLIETVGVGQSETDVSTACDVTVVVVQPGSGDTLQFIKAGLMEVFDVLVVNKADLGAIAQTARRDLKRALSVLGGAATAVVLTSAISGDDSVKALVRAIDTVYAGRQDSLASMRQEQLRQQTLRTAARLYGTLAIASMGGPDGALKRLETLGPTARPSDMMKALSPQ
jgi:LAO/AO transport system kinase